MRNLTLALILSASIADDAKQSGDQEFHARIVGNTVRCLYVPQGSV
jgi:hypothetical protein